MAVDHPYEGSKLQINHRATPRGIRAVSEILQKKRPYTGEPFERLVLDEVNYYIEDDAVNKNDRAEAVVKMVDALLELPHMQGMRKGVFPYKVGHDFVEKVHDFFESKEGRMFLKKMFEPAGCRPSSVGGSVCPSSYSTIPSMSGTTSMKSVGISRQANPTLQACALVSEEAGPQYLGLVRGNALDGRRSVVVGGLIVFVVFIAINLCLGGIDFGTI